MRNALAAVAVSMVMLAGCQASDPIARYNLGPARPVVEASVQQLGGLAAWQDTREIHATGVLVYLDPDGRRVIEQMQIEMDIVHQTLAASGRLPSGPWKALLKAPGRCEAQGRPATSELCGALGAVLHRGGGPLNMLFGGERPTDVGRVQVAGKTYIRVGVAGGSFDTRAYYFDAGAGGDSGPAATAGELRFITNGGDAPGSAGTVTTFDNYAALNNGIRLPQTIRVYRIGGNVLMGQDVVMEIDLEAPRAVVD